MQAYLGFDICNKMQALKTVETHQKHPKTIKNSHRLKGLRKKEIMVMRGGVSGCEAQ